MTTLTGPALARIVRQPVTSFVSGLGLQTPTAFMAAKGSQRKLQSTFGRTQRQFSPNPITFFRGWPAGLASRRGLDQMVGSLGATSFLAPCGAYVDAGGGKVPDNSLIRGTALQTRLSPVMVFL